MGKINVKGGGEGGMTVKNPRIEFQITHLVGGKNHMAINFSMSLLMSQHEENLKIKTEFGHFFRSETRQTAVN